MMPASKNKRFQSLFGSADVNMHKVLCYKDKGSIMCPWYSSCLWEWVHMWPNGTSDVIFFVLSHAKVNKFLDNSCVWQFSEHLQKYEQHTIWYNTPSTVFVLPQTLLQKTLACLWVSCRLFRQSFLDVALDLPRFLRYIPLSKSRPFREWREWYFSSRWSVYVCVCACVGEYFFSPPKTICSLNPSIKKVDKKTIVPQLI